MGEAAEIPDLRCPVCGGPLGEFPADHTCTGVRCLSCDRVWAVTTNPNHPTLDRTPYSVWVEWAGQDRNRVAAVVGNALCIGARAARELLDAGHPVRDGADVHEVRRLHQLFAELGLGIRVEPVFPWGWEPSPAELGGAPDNDGG
jgi:hypothetical protein